MEAADADSATGGPDMVRGIYPVVATIDSDGWSLVGDDELSDRYRTLIEQMEFDIMSMPYYVAPEQAMTTGQTP